MEGGDSVIKNEKKIYTIQIDKIIDKDIYIISMIMLGECFIFYLLSVFLKNSLFTILSVISYGLAFSLFLKRYFDIRLGGIITFPLLLYYSLGNLNVLFHFLIMVPTCLIVFMVLSKKGFIGEILFYLSLVFCLPIIVVSYYLIQKFFTPIVLQNSFLNAGILIYSILPFIYAYNLTKQDIDNFVKDYIITLTVLIVSIGIWVVVL